MKILYTLLFLGFATGLYAQQEAHFSQFMFNNQLYNPAYVGTSKAGSFTGIHRSQWLGFEGAPSSQILSFQTPLLKQRVGMGGTIGHYSIGITDAVYVSAAYSYNLKLTSYWSMRLGLQATLNYTGIDFEDEKAVVVSRNDPSFGNNELTDFYRANIGVGMFLTYRDLFYMGASIPRIYPNEVGLNDLVFISAEVAPHRYFTLGAALPVAEKLEMMPNMLVKWVTNAPISADMNLNFRYDKKVTAGVTYRTGVDGIGESVDALLFFQFSSKLGLGLAYDMTLSEIRDYQSGSVEILMKYDLYTEKGDLENPRYFKKQ